jgi:hypothetical protein
MDRRTFLTTAGVAAAAPVSAAARVAVPADEPQYFELRRYHALAGPGRRRLTDFLQEAALPAWNRHGIAPIGVFSVLYGPSRPTVYVLLPHPSLASVVQTPQRLAEDAAYREAGAAFLNTPLDEPAYVRMESSLMRAFSGMPRLEAPAGAAENAARLFELRVYESHSEPAGQRKIEMFNAGGEIAIFRKTGLTPVFFGETLVGPQMPNLTYMLTFSDMAARDQAWEVFREDPDWIRLRDDPYYADTVSNITDIILQPAPFSQV